MLPTGRDTDGTKTRVDVGGRSPTASAASPCSRPEPALANSTDQDVPPPGATSAPAENQYAGAATKCPPGAAPYQVTTFRATGNSQDPVANPVMAPCRCATRTPT